MTNGIRPATLDDSDFLVDCVQAMLADMQSYGGQPLAEFNHVKEWLKKYIESWLVQEEHVFLLAVPDEVETQPVGMVEAYLTFPDEAFRQVRKLHIAAIYVRPERRHAGIGRSLLEAAIEWGRELGCEQVELNVLAGNPARRLYENMGFEVFEVQERMRISCQPSVEEYQ